MNGLVAMLISFAVVYTGLTVYYRAANAYRRRIPLWTEAVMGVLIGAGMVAGWLITAVWL